MAKLKKAKSRTTVRLNEKGARSMGLVPSLKKYPLAQFQTRKRVISTKLPQQIAARK